MPPLFLLVFFFLLIHARLPCGKPEAIVFKHLRRKCLIAVSDTSSTTPSAPECASIFDISRQLLQTEAMLLARRQQHLATPRTSTIVLPQETTTGHDIGLEDSTEPRPSTRTVVLSTEGASQQDSMMDMAFLPTGSQSQTSPRFYLSTASFPP